MTRPVYWPSRATRRFDGRNRRAAREANDVKFEALSRIASRALVVAAEVSLLLRNGFQIGAYTRWRTMHEAGLFAMLIAQEGPDIAERFLIHRKQNTRAA
jgi:hypothetical protein